MTCQTIPAGQSPSEIRVAPIGKPALTALDTAVARAQAHDSFAAVIIVTDHEDVARSVRNLLGSRGVVNVTVQTGERLASELAQPILRPPGGDPSRIRKPLSRLFESQAIRRVAAPSLDSGTLQLSSSGQRRLHRSLAAAFREMQDRQPSDVPDALQTVGAVDVEELYAQYRALLEREGFYTRGELPGIAADAAQVHWETADLPAIIYYLPRRLSGPEFRLISALLAAGRCQVIAGLTGEPSADAPARALVQKLSGLSDPFAESSERHPLQPKIDAGSLSVITAPDPTEEVRAVVRRIVAGANETPFHRIAIVHRQDSPYASLLRQELTFAGVPHSGQARRTLSETPAGRLLSGLVGLALDSALNPSGPIDRESLFEWLTAAPVKHRTALAGERAGGRWRTVPATAWARIARSARANGAPGLWQTRLDAYIARQLRLRAEFLGESESAMPTDTENPALGRERQLADELSAFVRQLSIRLHELSDPPDASWPAVSASLRELFDLYLWKDADSADDLRILEFLESLPGLGVWGTPYDVELLRDSVYDALDAPMADQGQPVGAGVYIGPPSGAVGARYHTVYLVGMVERQFPPGPRSSPWLGQNAEGLQREAALERYDFIGAIASADAAVLSCPVIRDHQNAAHPSRWLVEAANKLHRASGHAGRLNYETLSSDTDAKPWLTSIPSRESGLAQLAVANVDEHSLIQPADSSDYNLMHLFAHSKSALESHPALQQDQRLLRALTARAARSGGWLSEWDGKVGNAVPSINSIGTRSRPVSASALERWATCPFQYFLSRVLRLETLPDPESDEISPLERGSLVHKILERFVGESEPEVETLLALAEEEFAYAERSGMTGYHLLWEIEKSRIRDGLENFLTGESAWLEDTQQWTSQAEIPFGPHSAMGEVGITVPMLGEVWFRGKIDRIDTSADEARVRDFKSGRPTGYRPGSQGAPADRRVANGLALQLPIYLEAAQKLHPERPISASYCFPLARGTVHDVARYTGDEEELGEFHDSLTAIVGAARSGTFPATPDSPNVWRGNCHYCEFQRLCHVRRRYFWEAKGQNDPDAQPFNSLGGRAAVAPRAETEESRGDP